MFENRSDQQLLEDFQVHSSVAARFLDVQSKEIGSGKICTCGHPEVLHKGRCGLIEVCGCIGMKTAGSSADIRPFFQITHGPIESHALGLGMALADSLRIDTSFTLHCKNWCKVYWRIGACRQPKSNPRSVLARHAYIERHEIFCDRCITDFVI